MSINHSRPFTVGLYGIGLDTYWPQFPGLYERLQGYQQAIAERISREHPQIKLINTGIVDNPERARQIGTRLAREQVDMVLLYISTYALSSTVLPVVQQVKAPVIVLSLQPTARIDYAAFNALADRGVMTGEWLAYCQACSAPEIASVFNRSHIDYHLVAGTLEDQAAWKEINGWLAAGQAAVGLAETRIGILGHYYGGMLDVYSDKTGLSAVFGSHFEIVEIGEILRQRSKVSAAQVQEKLKEFEQEFLVDAACSLQELDRAARTSLALDAVVEEKRLGALAYYYEGIGDPAVEDLITSVIPGNTLLTMHGVPVAGEYEIKNVIAMKILDLLGIGGSFSEFYALDLNEDIVLLGHDGPGHAAIAQGKVRLMPVPVYHGKPGKGLSVQMSVQYGPVTLLAVVQPAEGGIKLLCAQGQSLPGPVLEIGNTNSRYKFDLSAVDFLTRWSEQGPSHHMAIGVGHYSAVLEKLASLVHASFCRVC
ncbi:MAG TPA: arabinose isomerase [bacterium]|nr:arabinose isomerase [bacterium]